MVLWYGGTVVLWLWSAVEGFRSEHDPSQYRQDSPRAAATSNYWKIVTADDATEDSRVHEGRRLVNRK